MTYHWQCPFCGRQATLTENSYRRITNYVYTNDEGKDGNLNYELLYIVCPNKECKEYTLDIEFYRRVIEKNDRGSRISRNGEKVLSSRLRPRGAIRPFPDYIPENLRNDYTEACLIIDDSPKASATLARRCLQGLIRQYYKIEDDTLYLEIKALEDKLPPDLWKAVDSIREVGNIGAHSEKDITKMVDVPPEAARALVELIELLFEETYIRDQQRQERINHAIKAAETVKANKAEAADRENQT